MGFDVIDTADGRVYRRRAVVMVVVLLWLAQITSLPSH